MIEIFTCLFLVIIVIGERTPESITHFHNNHYQTIVSGFSDFLLLSGVSFTFDKSELTKESYSVLDSLGNVVKENPQLDFEIKVHSDLHGNDAFNKKLTEKKQIPLRVIRSVHEWMKNS